MDDERLQAGGNNPPAENPFDVLKQRADVLVENAEKWIKERPKITSAEQQAAAKDFLDQLVGESRAATAMRKALNKPHETAIGATNQRFAPVVTRLDTAIGIMRSKIYAWLKEERDKQVAQARDKERAAIAAQRAADEASRAAQAALTAGRGDVIGTLVVAEEAAAKATDAFREADKAAAVTPVARGSYGGRGTGLRTNWKYEVTDASLVPREWLEPALTKISDAVRRKDNPVREIPGVRIWGEESAV